MQTVNLHSSAYGSYSLQVVGEDSYQDEIKEVVNFNEEDGETKFREDGLTATLIFEDNNIHDPGNAIRVDIGYKTVGYLSPHKLRHGHVVHALKQAHNMSQLKAISQNIMHASVVTTDGIYGDLVNNDIMDIISNLGQSKDSNLEDKLTELIDLLKKNKKF